MLTRTLPPNPCLENLRNQAKTLKAGHKKADPEVLSRIKEQLPGAENLSEAEITDLKFPLHDAQMVLAREYGFTSWPKLKHHVEPPDNLRLLKEAIDNGDTGSVSKLIKQYPALLNENLPVNMGYFPRDIKPLSYACFRGEVDIVKELVNSGCDPAQDDYGCLSWINAKSLQIWKFFVEGGMDVNKPVIQNGFSLISLSAMMCFCENIKWLLENGADPNLVPEKNHLRLLDMALLFLTVTEWPQKQEIVKILLEAGAKSQMANHPVYRMLTGQLDIFSKELDRNPALVNSVLPNMSAHDAFDENIERLKGWTMMHLAAYVADYDAVKILLSKGGDVNIQASYPDPQNGITPAFMLLVQMRRVPPKNEEKLKILELLIEKGTDLSLKANVLTGPRFGYGNKSGTQEVLMMNLLDFALASSEVRLQPAIDLLVKHGAKPSNLFGAARLGMIEEVKKHLQAGSDPNEKGINDVFDDSEITPISAACTNGHEDVCEILLDAGAKNTISALDAVISGNMKVLERILSEAPSQINLRGKMMLMPLHEAAIHNRTEAIELLLDKGANVECRDQFGNTPLHRAVEFSSIDSIKLLIDRGADIHARSISRATPIIHAVWAGASIEIIELLLKCGANINDKNAYGTLLGVARLWHQKKIADYLVKQGAEGTPQ
ncbi:MAG: ankyrin repeat domain-containing protein [Phycisphaerae bacterium]|nr:ankyrin repeat domain-containing protein [Phycisphaerae bacterium]